LAIGNGNHVRNERAAAVKQRRFEQIEEEGRLPGISVGEINRPDDGDDLVITKHVKRLQVTLVIVRLRVESPVTPEREPEESSGCRDCGGDWDGKIPLVKDVEPLDARPI